MFLGDIQDNPENTGINRRVSWLLEVIEEGCSELDADTDTETGAQTNLFYSIPSCNEKY